MAGSDEGDPTVVEAALDKDQTSKEGLAKPKKKRPKIDPCSNCDYDSAVCSRCRRDGEKCVRGRTKIKFRHGSSARYDSGFSKDQPWIKPADAAKQLEYIDETEDLVAYYTRGGGDLQDSDGESDGDGQLLSTSGLQLGLNRTTSHNADKKLGLMGPPSPPRLTPNSRMGASPLKRQKTDELGLAQLTTNNGMQGADDLPAISPALSFLNLHSPVHGTRLSFSASPGISSPFDYASLLGLSEQELNNTLLQYNAETSLSPRPGSVQGAFLPGLVKQPSLTPSTAADIPDVGRLEAALLRHFVENLAKWFDLCDPEKHFELVVPQRARSSPTLMNAILTASARHLTRLAKYKTPDGIVQWEGQLLPDLTPETALHYHNKVIKDLIRLSMDPNQVQDENLLAAAIILRFYEEVDSPLREEGDGEVFLRVINIFVNQQAPEMPALPHSSPMINHPNAQVDFNMDINPQMQVTSPTSSQHTPPSVHSASLARSGGPQPRVTRADGLRQAAFWVGFRQEIYNAFMKQRTFTFPLSRCEAFRSFSPAEDAVWADRLIIFCADVLEFCHGNHNIDPTSTRDRYLELKQYEKTWSSVLPASFEPIFFKEPDRHNRNEVFPEIWYLADCHVAGIQHVELARILLAVYDPTRPKLGPGHVASMKALSTELKAIVLRLCGIALSNKRSPPGIVTACMGITMCGEHFEDRIEQDALLGVLHELENEHAWPVGNTVEMLMGAWGRM